MDCVGYGDSVEGSASADVSNMFGLLQAHFHFIMLRPRFLGCCPNSWMVPQRDHVHMPKDSKATVFAILAVASLLRCPQRTLAISFVRGSVSFLLIKSQLTPALESADLHTLRLESTFFGSR